MRAMPSKTVDFILADPPYVARSRSRDGRKIATTTTPIGFVRPLPKRVAIVESSHTAHANWDPPKA